MNVATPQVNELVRFQSLSVPGLAASARSCQAIATVLCWMKQEAQADNGSSSDVAKRSNDCISRVQDQDAGGRVPMIPKWLSWMVLAIVSWGIWAVLSGVLGDAVSAVHSQVLSTVGMLPIMAVMLPYVRSGADRGVRLTAAYWKGAALAFGGGIVSSLGNVGYYYVLSRGGEMATTVVPLTALYPVVTILLAVILLRERLSRQQWVGVLLSMVAIYLLNVRANGDWASSWLLVCLVPIFLWGITGFLQKVTTSYISGEASAVWFLLAFLVTAPLLLWHDPLTGTITGRTWWLTLTIGFTLALGNFAILAAFRHEGKAAIIAPLSGLYPLVSIPLAVWWLDETIDQQKALGILTSLLAVALLSIEPKTHTSEVNA